MRIIVNGERCYISLYKREWHPMSGESTSPDCFVDVEDNLSENATFNEDTMVWETNSKCFDRMVEYWEQECELFNLGLTSEQFGDRDGRAIEYILEYGKE